MNTFYLEEFYGDSIPKYAILSHTWGSEEVSFQDIQALRTTNIATIDSGMDLPSDKEGWLKIGLTAREAIEDGLEYIWIDTCCIDKSSSAELTEAINSMYQWYAKAAECYAYMSDVPAKWAQKYQFPLGDEPDEFPVYESMQSPFTKSRWFTRGWTLQELIAPTRLKFYAENFEYIGRKSHMARLISIITGIDIYILLVPEGLSDICIARKMSWASSRMTTRIEDEAYCLLGLFGVNIPLIYGEGKRAFRRLQEEIIRSTNDQSILAWVVSSEKWDDFTHWTGDRILAADTSYFADCGNLVRYYSSKTRPHSLSSIGLEMTAPIMQIPGEGDEHTYHAIVLDCRREDDFRGPIALKVRLRKGDVNFEALTGSNRIGRIDLKMAETAPEIMLVLQRAEEKKWSATTTAFWIKLENTTGHPRLGVHEAYPPQGYSRDTGVMRLNMLDERSAAVRLLKLGFHTDVVVVFGLDIKPWARLLISQDHPLSLAETCRSITATGQRLKEDLLSLESLGLYLTAAIEGHTIMNETVNIINIAVKRTDMLMEL